MVVISLCIAELSVKAVFRGEVTNFPTISLLAVDWFALRHYSISCPVIVYLQVVDYSLFFVIFSFIFIKSSACL